MRLIKNWVLTVLMLCLCTTVSWAGSGLSVASLLANPQSYRSKTVQVTGVVSNYRLKHVKNWTSNEDNCVQSFTVKDGTGSIQAQYSEICTPAMNWIRNRDRVTVEARIEWAPGKTAILNVESVLSKVSLFQ